MKRDGMDGTPLCDDCAHKAVEALRELVALKDLADKFDAMKQDVHDFATSAVLDGIQQEYQRRKPAAWAAARALVTPNTQVQP